MNREIKERIGRLETWQARNYDFISSLPEVIRKQLLIENRLDILEKKIESIDSDLCKTDVFKKNMVNIELPILQGEIDLLKKKMEILIEYFGLELKHEPSCHFFVKKEVDPNAPVKE